MPEDTRKVIAEIKATTAAEHTVDARIAEATARQASFPTRNRAMKASRRRTS